MDQSRITETQPPKTENNREEILNYIANLGFKPVPGDVWLLKHLESGTLFWNGNCSNLYIVGGSPPGNWDCSFPSRRELTTEEKGYWRGLGLKVLEKDEIY